MSLLLSRVNELVLLRITFFPPLPPSLSLSEINSHYKQPSLSLSLTLYL